MSCERFREAVTDYGCGAAISPEAEAHLTGCVACQSELETQRRALADVDAELSEALSVPVSPDFVSRVMSNAVAAGAHRSVSGLRASWIGLAAAASIAAVVFVMSRPSSKPAPPTTVASKPAAPPPVVAAPAPVTPPRAARVVAHTIPSTPPKRDRPAAAVTREPEVIVPPDQLLAIARLQQLFRRGAIDNAMLPPQKSQAEVLSDLSIEPLTVPEITFPDIETSSRAAATGDRDRQ